jgi:glutamyl-tRNA reductase
MPIIAIGLNHRTSPVDVREKFAFNESEIPAVLSEFRERGLISEAVILSTCNRVELYAVTTSADQRVLEQLRSVLAESRRCHGAGEEAFYLYSEPQSVEHLFKVACGLDSMVLGETEILGQLKKAYDIALQHKLTGGLLNKAFQRAFYVAKHIRTSTNIQRGSISVGSAAVELAEKIFSRLNDRHVMVIGAGDTSEKTARSLLSRGAKSIIVANRSYEHAAELAAELGGRAVSFHEWEAEFQHVDIVISSTAAPHYILDKPLLQGLMKARKNRPLLLIDIAVPRDIDPEVNFLESVYLYNIDDLQAIAENYLNQRKQEVSKCEAFIREKAQGLLEALRGAPAFEGGLQMQSQA